MKTLLTLTLIFLTLASPTLAHPGNTAADGCHYCRTNCDKWGVAWDERHCHGGGEPAPIRQALPVYRAVKKPTPTPTLTPTPTRKITKAKKKKQKAKRKIIREKKVYKTR